MKKTKAPSWNIVLTENVLHGSLDHALSSRVSGKWDKISFSSLNPVYWINVMIHETVELMMAHTGKRRRRSR
jgi:hypothetical protein